MRFFLDGHSRIYVDDEDCCEFIHPEAVRPMFHQRYVMPQKKAAYTQTVRCPKSLTEQERSRLKDHK